ncbi:hypothetical protein DM860_004066 [Cuscuta australis]|uniref:Uncharacterized protein n=1 Tax=Cuscuta australis TaxID=267555 RepID=A0A328CVL8_9ASTE|nr:hypothetical protein DM860_004066 [Cuscuta australis]
MVAAAVRMVSLAYTPFFDSATRRQSEEMALSGGEFQLCLQPFPKSPATPSRAPARLSSPEFSRAQQRRFLISPPIRVAASNQQFRRAFSAWRSVMVVRW